MAVFDNVLGSVPVDAAWHGELRLKRGALIRQRRIGHTLLCYWLRWGGCQCCDACRQGAAVVRLHLATFISGSGVAGR